MKKLGGRVQNRPADSTRAFDLNNALTTKQSQSHKQQFHKDNRPISNHPYHQQFILHVIIEEKCRYSILWKRRSLFPQHTNKKNRKCHRQYQPHVRPNTTKESYYIDSIHLCSQRFHSPISVLFLSFACRMYPPHFFFRTFALSNPHPVHSAPLLLPLPRPHKAHVVMGSQTSVLQTVEGTFDKREKTKRRWGYASNRWGNMQMQSTE